jgi:hypothetical protein
MGVGSVGVLGGIPYQGRFYVYAEEGMYILNETDRTITQMQATTAQCRRPVIYNGKMFVPTQNGEIYKFDGSSWSLETDLNKALGGMGVLNGRLFAYADDGTIYHKTESVAEARNHGTDNPNPTSSWDNKEYLKKLLDYVGNDFPKYNSTGADVQRFPVYNSLNFLTQNNPLSSGIDQLDQELGDVSIPASGNVLPSGAASYGDFFYVTGSGFYRFGLSNWERLSTV